MALPSLEGNWFSGKRGNARLYLLDVRDKRHPEGAPIAQLLVEREETVVPDEKEGHTFEARLQLFYQVLWSNGGLQPLASGHFQASYRREFDDGEIVSLTGRNGAPGTVFLDPESLRGQRVGTYLMNELVAWVQRWPEADVHPIQLENAQAYEANRARRNRFYERFGIVFDYQDAGHQEGRSRPMKVRELRPVLSWQENIQERDIRDVLETQRRENERLTFERDGRVRALEQANDQLRRACRQPLRWAVSQLWRLHAPSRGAVLLALMVAGMLWWQFKS